MGTWGIGLFSDDVACDVRDYYRELIEDGVEDAAATRQTIEKFGEYLNESGGVGLLALAVTQSKAGRLDPAVRDRALAVLARGADLAEWERDNPGLLAKRRATLERVRAQLTGAQPRRRTLRPPKRVSSGLAAGDVLALDMPGAVALLRVVGVRQHRRGESPILEQLDYEGTHVPQVETIETLGPTLRDPIPLVTALSPDTRFFAFVMQGVDWVAAGFRKVASIDARAGDPDAPLPSSGVSWAQVAERCRRRGPA